MISIEAYQLAKHNVNNFVAAGPSDDEMIQSLIEIDLQIRLLPKGEQRLKRGYALIAISAAIVSRYEEQNNLQCDSPTNLSTVGTLDNK